jgi:hypothetical protein
MEIISKAPGVAHQRRHLDASRPKKYLGKQNVALRYDKSVRWVDRAARDGRLPPAELYLDGPKWSEGTLDAHDEAMEREAAALREARAVQLREQQPRAAAAAAEARRARKRTQARRARKASRRRRNL